MTVMVDRLVHPAASTVGEGNALLRAAAAAGHGTRVRELLDNGWSESAREDVALMLWAADYGAYQVIHNRLDEHTTEPMLRIARAWVGVDPIAELRRRLGDATAVVQRRRVRVDEYDHTECIRVTAADGRWAEVQTAHLAIVTYIEERLGIGASRDELMARALMDRDPDSVNWSESWRSVTSKQDVEGTLHWAGTVLTDADPDARRFAAEVVHLLAINQEDPWPEDIISVLHTRLSVEPDVGVLIHLIIAFSNYHLGLPPEILVHAEHPNPRVRSQVAYEHYASLSGTRAVPEAVESLAKLAQDPDGRVRATALTTFRDHAFDHPVTKRLIAAGRDDSDPRVRVEALAGLARGGDTAAYAELRQLGDEAGKGSYLAMMADNAKGWLNKLAAAQAPPPPAQRE
jgi:hypothetical protein